MTNEVPPVSSVTSVLVSHFCASLILNIILNFYDFVSKDEDAGSNSGGFEMIPGSGSSCSSPIPPVGEVTEALKGM